MAQSSRSGIRTALKLVTAAIGLFLLLEISARVYLFGPVGLLPERINSIRGLPQTGFTQPAPSDSGRVFDLKPDLDEYFKAVPFRTNRIGLRDREYELRKPKNTFRVAVLGASFALPAGVAIEQAFHSLLEERLTTEFQPRNYEFINFAIGMYSPAQMLAMLETRALAFEPDLILITATELSAPLFTADPRVRPAQMTPAARQALRERFDQSFPFLQSFFVRMVLQRLGYPPDKPGTQVGILERFYMNLVRRWSESTSRFEPTQDPGAAVARAQKPIPERERYRTVLERFAEIRRQNGIPIVIVRLEFNTSEMSEADIELDRRAHELGIAYLDTRDAFEGTRASDFWIFEFDRHPNARAHEIFAQAIARFLRANHLIPD